MCEWFRSLSLPLARGRASELTSFLRACSLEVSGFTPSSISSTRVRLLMNLQSRSIHCGDLQLEVGSLLYTVASLREKGGCLERRTVLVELSSTPPSPFVDLRFSSPFFPQVSPPIHHIFVLSPTPFSLESSVVQRRNGRKSLRQPGRATKGRRRSS